MYETPLIAIVDDDAPLRSALANLVRSAGYRVVSFENAESVLATDPDGGVTLVVSDYRMPGATGLDLIRALRARGCRAHVIIMTAVADAALIAAAEAAGAAAFLQKPFNDTDLLDTIESVLQTLSAPAAPEGGSAG